VLRYFLKNFFKKLFQLELNYLNLFSKKVFFYDKAQKLKMQCIEKFILEGHCRPLNVPFIQRDVVEGDTRPYAIAKEIQRKGYYVIEDYIPLDVCRRVVAFAERAKSHPRPKDGFPEREPVCFGDEDSYCSARYDFSPSMFRIFLNEDLQDLIADPFLYRIAEVYLGSEPYLDPVELWWFVPFSERDDAWAEEYHFDHDAPRWLKFFFNFEDINLCNGPHCFIEGTHLDNGIPSEIRRRGYARNPDSLIFSQIDKSREKIFTVKAGSLLIEDTRGLHKGLTPVEGRRLMFQYQLSNYLFVSDDHAPTRLDLSFKMSTNFQNLFEKRPDFFSRYVEVRH
jgi:hypothetical protein